MGLKKLRRAAQMPLLYENFPTAYRHRFLRQRDREGVVDYRLRNGITISMSPGPQDIRVLNEIWGDRAYAAPGFMPEPGWRILDVGAHKGNFALYAMSEAEATVTCYEPHPRTFKLLSLNLDRFGSGEAVNAGIGSRDGQATLHEIAGNTGQSSLDYDRADVRGTISRTFTVDVLALSEAIERAGGEIDLCKIDVEGAEYDILLDSPVEVVKRLRRIVMELDPFSPTDASVTRDDLIAHLQRAGYTVTSRGHNIVFARQ